MKRKPRNSHLTCRVTNEDYLAVQQMAAVMKKSTSELLSDLIHFALKEKMNEA